MTDPRIQFLVMGTLAGLAVIICFAAIFAILVVPGPHEAATAGLASAFSSIIGFMIGFMSKGNADKPAKPKDTE